MYLGLFHNFSKSIKQYQKITIKIKNFMCPNTYMYRTIIPNITNTVYVYLLLKRILYLTFESSLQLFVFILALVIVKRQKCNCSQQITIST